MLKPLSIVALFCTLIFQPRQFSPKVTEHTYPIFIGYTEKAIVGGTDYHKSKMISPVKIHSLSDFESKFGKGQEISKEAVYLFYNSIRLFYENGGSSCYIVSVGEYSTSISQRDLLLGLEAIEPFETPTLLVIPETVNLRPLDAGSIHKAMLKKAHDMGNSFAILDMVNGDLPIESEVNPILTFKRYAGTEYLQYGAVYYPWLKTAFMSENPQMRQLAPTRSMNLTRKLVIKKPDEAAPTIRGNIILPPGAAVAAKFVQTDIEKGIWKAAANVGIAGVVGPTVMLSDANTETLNVDMRTGKSINAIRTFTGKGTLIWGARTLAGNDYTFRYIPVTRLTGKIQADLKREMARYSSQSNDAKTWQNAKTDAESYLMDLWRKGALAGSKPKEAYFVNVGLGQTMTQSDISDGKMIIAVGFSHSKPAEFHTIIIEQRMGNPEKQLIRQKRFRTSE